MFLFLKYGFRIILQVYVETFRHPNPQTLIFETVPGSSFIIPADAPETNDIALIPLKNTRHYDFIFPCLAENDENKFVGKKATSIIFYLFIYTTTTTKIFIA